jgi:hypothetical protein
MRSADVKLLFKNAVTAVFKAVIFVVPVPSVLAIDPDRSKISIRSTGRSGPASANAATSKLSKLPEDTRPNNRLNVVETTDLPVI